MTGVIAIFSQIETKFISVKTLISKPSITLLSENEARTSTCSPDVKQKFLASNSQGLLRNKGCSLKGRNKSLNKINKNHETFTLKKNHPLLNNEIL